MVCVLVYYFKVGVASGRSNKKVVPKSLRQRSTMSLLGSCPLEVYRDCSSLRASLGSRNNTVLRSTLP